jgi:hypothetical protein
MRAELYLEIINGDFVLCPILCIAEVENNRHSGNIRNISLYRNTLNSINQGKPVTINELRNFTIYNFHAGNRGIRMIRNL